MTRLRSPRLPRWRSATIAAFFVTQHLKVSTPLIRAFRRPVPGVINPLNGVPVRQVHQRLRRMFSFYLLHRCDEVNVHVVNYEGEHRAHGRHRRAHAQACAPERRVPLGRPPTDGSVAPDGTYYIRVALIHQDRGFDLTDVPVTVKTVPPHPVITSVTPSVDCAGEGSTKVTIHYTGNEGRGGTILLYRSGAAGHAQLIKNFLTPGGADRGVGRHGRRQRPRRRAPTCRLEVTDAACNTGRYPARIPPPAGPRRTTSHRQ